MAVTMLSLNVKGLNSPFKWSMLWKEARATRAAIVCAQETHLKKDSPVKLRNLAFPHIYFACSDKKKAGILIAINHSVQFNLLQTVINPNRRFIILVCRIDNILCSYAPNSQQIAFLNKLRRKVDKVKQGRLLWCLVRLYYQRSPPTFAIRLPVHQPTPI